MSPCQVAKRRERSVVVSVREAAAIEPVGDVVAELGEGPYWVPEDDCLLWVDIRRIGDRGQGLLAHHETSAISSLIPNCR